MADLAVDTQTTKRQILYHYCYCVGQGAEAKWVDGEALRALVDRYTTPIDRIIEQHDDDPGDHESLQEHWKRERFYVLQWFREIGREALKTSATHAFINKAALQQAWQRVEASAESGGFMGRWCQWVG